MEKYYDILKSSPLFEGIEKSEMFLFLECVGARVRKYAKNQTIFSVGDEARYVGIFLLGEGEISQEDYNGNLSIIAKVEPGELFGESYAAAKTKALPIKVCTTKESEILLIDFIRLTHPCPKACGFHSELIRNLLFICAKKNIALNRKIEFMSKSSTKEKLMSYLLFEANSSGSETFIIPYSRQSLADYLGVDRSAMSRELSALRREGKIEFKKNRFKIKERHHADQA